MILQKDYEANINTIKNILPLDSSFDVIGRALKVGNKSGYLIFIDGFAKDEVMYFIINNLQEMNSYSVDSIPVTTLIKNKIAYLEVETFTDLEQMKHSVLSGALALIIEGEEEGIIIDAREYPVRSPEEADTEKVTRGSKDGFVETIVFNTALIRRRVRDPYLIFEIKSVGKRSKTDVVIGYIDDLVDKKVLKSLKDKIDKIEIETLVMAEKSLEELLIKKKWYNPLPQVKYSERPDIVASYLAEGHIVVLVDTSPSAMIIPATIFYFTQYAEDYYENPLVANYTRFIRFCAILVALFLTPVWILLSENSEILPEFLKFIGAKESTTFSLLVQFLILEFGFDLLKMSSMHTPGYLGSAFGIIGGLLLGDFAIKVGFFVNETIFYMALTAMATYCIPNVEFGQAIRLFRLFLIIMTGLFGFWGFGIALVLILIIVFTTETLDKSKRYTWPLIPLNWNALSNIIFRKSVHRHK